MAWGTVSWSFLRELFKTLYIGLLSQFPSFWNETTKLWSNGLLWKIIRAKCNAHPFFLNTSVETSIDPPKRSHRTFINYVFLRLNTSSTVWGVINDPFWPYSNGNIWPYKANLIRSYPARSTVHIRLYVHTCQRQQMPIFT